MKSLVWFRRDLRLHDQPALLSACEHSDEGVLAVFTITPRQWREHDEAAGKIHLWLRNLESLSDSLDTLNIPLLIVNCDSFREVPGEIVALARHHHCGRLYFNREYEINERRRDRAVVQACEGAGIEVHRYHDRAIVPPKQISTKEGRFYTVFTPYRRVWDAKVTDVDPPLAAPKPQPSMGTERSPIPSEIDGFDFAHSRSDLWIAGEPEAEARLARFCDRIGAYDKHRDIPSVCGTSILSPYLSAGIISARQCLAAVLQTAGDELAEASGVTTWISELTWRDFYTHVLVGFPRVCMHQAFNQKNDSVNWRYSESDFQAWCEGRTGYPIVDAGMRQLNQTGWMHNRLRMITAMFLTKHLLIDWRWGERYFMSNLVDGDLAANNGGWQWSASTGTDAVPYFRIFNPFSQSKRFDPDGTFIKKFCPELEEVPKQALHDPEKLTAAIKATGVDYPPLIVQHKVGRERALAEFKRAGRQE